MIRHIIKQYNISSKELFTEYTLTITQHKSHAKLQHKISQDILLLGIETDVQNDIEIIRQKKVNNGDNWSSTSMAIKRSRASFVHMLEKHQMNIAFR